MFALTLLCATVSVELRAYVNVLADDTLVIAYVPLKIVEFVVFGTARFATVCTVVDTGVAEAGADVGPSL
jgi:hypothetical protein